MTEVHPFAAAFPMMPEDELNSLVEDITVNGLRQPIVVDADGRVIDGRNRFAACEQADVAPQFVVYDGDPVDYIVSANVERRHLTTGQRAMARAMALTERGNRQNGRWARGVLNDQDLDRSRAYRVAMAQAGVVLDEIPNDAPAVLAGTKALDAAYKVAQQVRADRDTDTARLAALREHAPDLAALVDNGADVTEQHAAWRERARAAAEERRRILSDGDSSARALDAVLAHVGAVVGALQLGAQISPDPLIGRLREAADALDELTRSAAHE